MHSIIKINLRKLVAARSLSFDQYISAITSITKTKYFIYSVLLFLRQLGWQWFIGFQSVFVVMLIRLVRIDGGGYI